MHLSLLRKKALLEYVEWDVIARKSTVMQLIELKLSAIEKGATFMHQKQIQY